MHQKPNRSWPNPKEEECSAAKQGAQWGNTYLFYTYSFFFILQLLFTFKLLRMHFNWFSYKLLKICSLFCCCWFSYHIFYYTFYFIFLLGLLDCCEHTWAEVLVTRTHTRSVYMHAHAHALVHTNTHTHTRARAGDAKKAIEKFIVVVDSDAWLDSGAGEDEEEEEKEHVFFFFIKFTTLRSLRFISLNNMCFYLLLSLSC